MTTTFEKFAGKQAGNYSTLPTKDVEIEPDVNYCQGCGKEIVRAPDDSWSLGQRWRHMDSTVPDHGYVGPMLRCAYCRSHDAVYRQHAWYDAVECPRCGAVSGYAIGD